MNRMKMMIASLAVAVAWGQGPQGPQNPGGMGNPPRTGAGLNMMMATTVQGVITDVQVAAGAQYPTILVNKQQIKVAPVWFLLENDFELKAGESVSVLAAPSNNSADGYLHAIRITKAGGVTLTLRSEKGVPIWTGPATGRGGSPMAPRTGTGCVDPSSVKTVNGVIDRVNAALGVQFPVLVLKADDGNLLTIKIGPERAILASDFELNPGDKLTVKYGLATCGDELVTLELTDAKGNTLTLRNDDGTPAWK
jgi:hypothetical protein